jgi:hypothetical protein
MHYPEEVIKNGLNKREFPDDVLTPVDIEQLGKGSVKKGLIEIVFMYSQACSDDNTIATAEELVKRGAPLPTPSQTRENFISKYDYFQHLLGNPLDLFIALHQTPEIINEKDEGENTLLHHLFIYALRYHKQYYIITLILPQLLNAPNVDFTAKNDSGNTPLHEATTRFEGSGVINNAIFTRYLEEAQRRGFDFSTQHNDGYTCLHHMMIGLPWHIVDNNRHLLQENLHSFLKIVKNPPLDIVSNDRHTVLYSLINNKGYEEARILIAAGALPNACGDSVSSPLELLEGKLTYLKFEIKQENDPARKKKYIEERKELLALKNDILSAPRMMRNLGIGLSVIGLLTLPVGIGVFLLIPGLIATILGQKKCNTLYTPLIIKKNLARNENTEDAPPKEIIQQYPEETGAVKKGPYPESKVHSSGRVMFFATPIAKSVAIETEKTSHQVDNNINRCRIL